jgi:sec-independent protein translocase protein TatA
MFNGIGFQEIVVILILALLLFGAKRIPEIARALGKGMMEFKDALAGKSREEDKEDSKANTENRSQESEELK